MWTLTDCSTQDSIKFEYICGKGLSFEISVCSENEDLKPVLLELLSKKERVTGNELIGYFDFSLTVDIKHALPMLKEIIKEIEK